MFKREVVRTITVHLTSKDTGEKYARTFDLIGHSTDKQLTDPYLVESAFEEALDTLKHEAEQTTLPG